MLTRCGCIISNKLLMALKKSILILYGTKQDRNYLNPP